MITNGAHVYQARSNQFQTAGAKRYQFFTGLQILMASCLSDSTTGSSDCDTMDVSLFKFSSIPSSAILPLTGRILTIPKVKIIRV